MPQALFVCPKISGGAMKKEKGRAGKEEKGPEKRAKRRAKRKAKRRGRERIPQKPSREQRWHKARGIEPLTIPRAPGENCAEEGSARKLRKRQEKSPPKRAFLYVGDRYVSWERRCTSRRPEQLCSQRPRPLRYHPGWGEKDRICRSCRP